MATSALIFYMDGTMVDSMPSHAKGWAEFTCRHDIAMEVGEVLRRTTGRNDVCMHELFGRRMDDEEAVKRVGEKEALYSERFAPVCAEVRGFCALAAQAAQHGPKFAVGTAGDRHNVEFVMSRLKMGAAAGHRRRRRGTAGQAGAGHLPGSGSAHRRARRSVHRV